MKYTTLAAIARVAIMALSVCTAVGVTTSTKADAATATKLTASFFPKYPCRGQQFTISGTLTTSDGKPLANKVIKISRVPGGIFDRLMSVKTDSQGRYMKVFVATAPRYFYTVTFAGDTTYAKASTTLNIRVGFSVTYLRASNDKPLRGQAITLRVIVKPYECGGTPTVDTVKIYRRVSDGQGGWTAWKEYKQCTVRFGTNQDCRVTAYGYTLDTQFKAVYQGNARLFSSESGPITLTGYGVD